MSVSGRARLWPALCCAAALQAHAVDETDGRQVYESHCLGCHQADGRGVPGMQPGLVDSPWLAVDGTALAAFVLSGAFGGSGVDGPENVMPPFRHLDDVQLAAVLSYVRAEFGTAADPVTVGEVRAARRGRTGPRR